MKKLDAITVYLGMTGIARFAYRMFFVLMMVYLVADLGFTPLQLVLVGTAIELPYLLLEVPTGVVADLVSRRLSVIVGYGLLAVSFLAMALSDNFVAWALLQIPAAAGFTFLSGANEAWLVDEVGEDEAARTFMHSAKVGSLAAVAGIITGALLGLIDHRIPMIVAGTALAVLTVLLVLLMPERNFKPVPRGDRTTIGSMIHTTRQGFSLLRGSSVLLIVALLILIDGLFSEGYDRLWAAHLIDSIGLPLLPIIGELDPALWFGAFNLVSALLIAWLADRLRQNVDLTDERKLGRGLLVSYTALTAGTLGFALSRSLPLALLFMWGMDVARGLSMPLTSALINRHIDSEVRATVLSMTRQSNALGQIVGGPVVGWIGNLRSIRAALVISSLILLPATPLVGWMNRRNLAAPSSKPLIREAMADDVVTP